MWKKLIDILFPPICMGCNSHLIGDEKYICSKCFNQVNWIKPTSKNAQHLQHKYFGKLQTDGLYALFYYNHDEVGKELLHHLKYKNRPEIGKWLGEIWYEWYRDLAVFDDIDGLLKVPIHPKRRKVRGYNQLDLLAKQIAKDYEIPIIENVLVRAIYTDSQTQKNRSERFYKQNVFAINNSELLLGKKLLIIDDVITTGNTLEQICQLLQEIDLPKPKVLALAVAQ